MEVTIRTILAGLFVLALAGCNPTPSPTPTPTSPPVAVRGLAYPSANTDADPDPLPVEPALPIHRVYFPQLFNPPPPPAVLGYEIAHESRVAGAMTQVEEIGQIATVWTRQSLNWRQVEPAPGRYLWPPAMDKAVDLLHPHANLLLVLADIPAWALQYPEWPCGPLDPAQTAAFADYAVAAVLRYQPEAVELWNEPDAPISPEAKGWGCWSISGQERAGGKAYGQAMLPAVAAIRKASPQTQILSGGLLFGCEVDGYFGCPGQDFLAGIQESGLLAVIDGVAFHAYAQWFGEDDPPNARYLAWKATTIRRITGDLSLWMTEGGYLCHPSAGELCESVTYREHQAAYVPMLAQECEAQGLNACIWYSLTYNGWRYADMLGPAGPELAYWAYLQELRRETRSRP